MSTAFAPPPPANAQPQFQAPPNPAAEARFDRNPGETVMSPIPPPPAGRPQWPTAPASQPQFPQQPATTQHLQQYQPQPQQFQQAQYQPPVYQQPVYQQPPQQPQYQQPQAPLFGPTAGQQAPMQQPPAPQAPQVFQQAMAPDPTFSRAAPFQFNDGLQLAGPTGGGTVSGQAPASAIAPAGSAAMLTPAGASYQQIPQQQPPQAPPATTLVRDNLLRNGMAVGHYQNDADLFDDLGATLSEIQQLRQLAHIGQQSLARERGLPAPTTPTAPAQPQQPAAPQQPQPNQAPEWNPDWSRLVKRNAVTGLMEPVDISVSPVIAERANEYERWQRQRADAILRDPMGTLQKEGLGQLLQQTREDVKREVMEELQAAERERAGQQRVQQFMEKNRATFYQLGPDGAPVTNPLTGRPVITPRGQAAQNYASQYRQQFTQTYGVDPDPVTVLDWVEMRLTTDEARGVFGPPMQPPMQMQPQQLPPQMAPYGYQPQMAYQPQAPQVQQPQLNQQLKDGLIQRAIDNNGAMYAPSQMGTIAAAATVAGLPQNARQSFRDMLFQGGKARGVLHPAA